MSANSERDPKSPNYNWDWTPGPYVKWKPKRHEPVDINALDGDNGAKQRARARKCGERNIMSTFNRLPRRCVGRTDCVDEKTCCAQFGKHANFDENDCSGESFNLDSMEDPNPPFWDFGKKKKSKKNGKRKSRKSRTYKKRTSRR